MKNVHFGFGPIQRRRVGLYLSFVSLSAKCEEEREPLLMILTLGRDQDHGRFEVRDGEINHEENEIRCPGDSSSSSCRLLLQILALRVTTDALPALR